MVSVSKTAWSHHCGQVVRQHILTEKKCWSRLLTSWWPGSRERETGRGQGQDIPFEGMPPMTYFPQSGPTSS
jgi:hypothetical protein